MLSVSMTLKSLLLGICVSGVALSTTDLQAQVFTTIAHLAAGLLWPAALVAQTVSDDFNDNVRDPAKWGPDRHIDGNGAFNEVNQRVEYTVSSASGAHSVHRPWVGNLPIDRSWDATLTVYNNTFPTGFEANAGIGLALFAPGADVEGIVVEHYTDPGSAAGPVRGIYTSFSLETEDDVVGDADTGNLS